jgi:D-alanine-D-alanine ligase
MSIDVDPEWWKTLFDDVYLITDARSVNDETITRQEVALFASLIPIRPDDRILDLCGGHGRHALELCRRGCCGGTVLDYSQALLDVGARAAAEMRYPIRFVQGDARRTGLPAETFEHVLILGNSLGYIMEPEADLHILKESRRLLKPDGWILIDVSDGDAARSKTAPQAWHEIGDDVVVCRQRELHEGRICARELVLSKGNGLIRDRTYCIRLYGAADLADLVTRAGFVDVQVHTEASVIGSDIDVGCMNHRLAVTARRC